MQLTFKTGNYAVYDRAEKLYREGAEELKRWDGLCGNSETHLHKPKSKFTICVALLSKLYSRGEVECIDELPLPHEISLFTSRELSKLVSTLRELYFPGQHK